MAEYLIHQTNDGTPIGVFSETDHYYNPVDAAQEPEGVAVVESKGTDTDWDDWVDQLAGKSPSPNRMWDAYAHPSAPLEDVLDDARREADYSQ